jgi:plasmid stability protein
MVILMKTITLKDIPHAVHVALKNRAKQHGRSLNKEALACLETAVLPTRVNIDDMLAEIRQHRASLPGRLTDRLIGEAKSQGRP